MLDKGFNEITHVRSNLYSTVQPQVSGLFIRCWET